MTDPRGQLPSNPTEGSPTPFAHPPTSGLIDRVVTSGTFSLDGGTWDVEINVWIVGDEKEVMVIDAAHDVDKPRSTDVLGR